MQWMHYVIIFVILIIIFLAVIRANKKDFKLEINKLVEYLGGRDNIIDTENANTITINKVVRF